MKNVLNSEGSSASALGSDSAIGTNRSFLAKRTFPGREALGMRDLLPEAADTVYNQRYT